MSKRHIGFPEWCQRGMSPSARECLIKVGEGPYIRPKRPKLGNELASPHVPDSNERACVRPTCKQSTVVLVLRPVNTHVIVQVDRMQLSSVAFP